MAKAPKKAPRRAFKKVIRSKASSAEAIFPSNIPKALMSKELKDKTADMPDFGDKPTGGPNVESAISSIMSSAAAGIPDFGDLPTAQPPGGAEPGKKDKEKDKEKEMAELDDSPTYKVPKDGIERTASGIKGLDALIRGGFPKGSSILVSGSAGTGKTILSLQFLVNGATMFKEKGLYISLEEDVERVKRYMNATFGWPLNELEKKKMISFVKSDIYDMEKFKSLIESNVEKLGAERIVIDPLTVISLFFERPLDIRRSLLDLDKLLKKLNCTTLLTVEVPEGMNSISSFGIEEFTCDGIVLLSFSFGVPRLITIRKMRATEHDTDARPFEIKYGKGIVVYPSKELFKFWKS
jgi:KaiC/GvpD/RAD55 family RecA-like ATPase